MENASMGNQGIAIEGSWKTPNMASFGDKYCFHLMGYVDRHLFNSTKQLSSL